MKSEFNITMLTMKYHGHSKVNQDIIIKTELLGFAREASYGENRTELYENRTELPVLRTCTLFIVMSRGRWMPDR